jgi:Derlin-2/3
MEDPIADFLEWYQTRPLVTKTFLTLSTLLSVLVTMDCISIYQVFYTFSETYPTLELWRPLTSLLYLGNLNFTFVLEAYFAYQALISAETGIFQR